MKKLIEVGSGPLLIGAAHALAAVRSPSVISFRISPLLISTLMAIG
jgi:hypothetical protein